VTQTAPPATDQPADDRLVGVALPAPGADGPVDGVALVTIRRPDVLNALSFDLLDALADVYDALDADPACRAIVLTGDGERAFAAGADIRELARQTSISLLVEDRFAVWDRIGAVRKPVIAAVRGFALGGGCELALTCDLIVASDDARFGQPEITIGVMPGAGGTQRLPRAIGKVRAMELVLTGRPITAPEAAAMGLVNRVVPADAVLGEALGLAAAIAAQPPVAVLAAKEAVKLADELPLAAGLRHERRAFFALFATEDQSEGMAAFAQKRPPEWKGR
jgi:enoyl-CoA hydratase